MILVTGAAGLLGKTLIEQLLQKGEKVRAYIHSTSSGIEHPNLEIFHGDILDVVALGAAMANVSQLYHAAAIVSFSPSDEARMIKVNVEGTANVVNAALAAGVQRMLHVSSVAALGRLRNEAGINETAQWTESNNNSNYGRTKYYGELEVWRGIAEGLNAVIVNPSIILGPADWNSGSSRLFKQVYDGSPWYTLGSTGVVDVRDVADAMIGLMASGIEAEKFIISGHNVSYKELFTQMAIGFGKKPPAKKVTPLLAKMVVYAEKLKQLFTGRDPLITAETARTALANISYDNSKLLKALPGFSYRSLEDTIKYSTAAFKQKINNS